MAKNAKIIQVEINPDRIGLTKKVSVGIIGDAALVANKILSNLSETAGDFDRTGRKQKIAEIKSDLMTSEPIEEVQKSEAQKISEEPIKVETPQVESPSPNDRLLALTQEDKPKQVSPQVQSPVNDLEARKQAALQRQMNILNDLTE